MKKPHENEKHDVLYGFVNKVVDERNRGRSLVFVDDKLLEWVDEQVDAGKYYNRSYAIEYALAEIKKAEKSKGDSKVLDRISRRHLTRDSLT